MIKLVNVNKYFNRHKKNEVHAIDNTSLELGDNGLVTLLGPSGCGKTTLLNAIGGLSKVSNGNIYINNERLTKTSIHKIDKLRALNIGYIFQDYNLLDNMSVYDNVSLPLKIIGITSKDEIDKRVTYALDLVGMYRYRNRLAGMLSGGERQRVGIARAIVKNPEVIIADEPTGNLDSNNSITVMNIIKSISKNKLVILVTHEKELANFYSDRIIEIKDGEVISDKENTNNNSLNYTIDNKIYLKDIKTNELLKSKNISIDYYNDTNKKVNIKLIVKNDNIYIETDNKLNIEVLNENSSIEVINDHYKEIDKSIYEEYNYDYNKFSNNGIKLKYKSIFNIFKSIKNGINTIINYSFLKKILLVGFFISSLFIVYSVSSIFSSTKINDKDFIKYNKNYLIVKKKNITVDEFNSISNLSSVNYALPGDSTASLTFKFDEYLQTNNTSSNISASLSSINMITSEDIIIGKYPTNSNEIVLDISTFSEEFKIQSKQTGFISNSDYLNKKVYLSTNEEYVIVGLTDNNSPSIYVNDTELINILYNSIKEEFSTNKYKDYTRSTYTLVKGSNPVNDYEVVINEIYSEEYKIGKYLDTKINNNKLKVVGYYKGNEEYLYINSNTVLYDYILSSNDIMIYSKDNNIYNELKGYNIIDSYTKSKNDYIDSIEDSIKSKVIFASIILIISLIEIYLIERSSFLSRVKEVGILRSIGVKRLDIYKMFVGEILSITLFASVPGILLMSYILYNISKISYLSSSIVINPMVVIISIIIVIVFNMLFGLLPVFITLLKRPHDILSRNDVE